MKTLYFSVLRSSYSIRLDPTAVIKGLKFNVTITVFDTVE